jgi:hypothetical protein
LIIDCVKTVIVGPIASTEKAGKQLPEMFQFVIGHPEIMIEPLSGCHCGASSHFPEKIRDDPVPGISSNAEFEITVPYFRCNIALYRKCIDMLQIRQVEFYKRIGIHGLMDKLAILVAIMPVIVYRCYYIITAATS